MGNWLTCSEDLGQGCDPPFYSYARLDCGGTRVSVGRSWHGYGVALLLDDGDTRATARLFYSTDLPEYDQDDRHADGGWVAIEEHSGSDITGTFDLQFGDSAVRGTFDTSEPDGGTPMVNTADASHPQSTAACAGAAGSG